MVLNAQAPNNLLHFSCRVAHSALYTALFCTTCFTRYNTSFTSFLAEALTVFFLYDSDWGKRNAFGELRNAHVRLFSPCLFTYRQKRFRMETPKCAWRRAAEAWCTENTAVGPGSPRPGPGPRAATCSTTQYHWSTSWLQHFEGPEQARHSPPTFFSLPVSFYQNTFLNKWGR